jgi:hypothetical protein
MEPKIPCNPDIPNPCALYPEPPMSREYFEHVRHCDECQKLIAYLDKDFDTDLLAFILGKKHSDLEKKKRRQSV